VLLRGSLVRSSRFGLLFFFFRLWAGSLGLGPGWCYLPFPSYNSDSSVPVFLNLLMDPRVAVSFFALLTPAIDSPTRFWTRCVPQPRPPGLFFEGVHPCGCFWTQRPVLPFTSRAPGISFVPSRVPMYLLRFAGFTQDSPLYPPAVRPTVDLCFSFVRESQLHQLFASKVPGYSF